METPMEGFNAAARGTLLHAFMKGIWDRLQTQAALLAADAALLDEVLVQSAAAAVEHTRRDYVIGDAFAALERERLARLGRDWLEIERARPSFEVVASEAKRPLLAGGLRFAGRIDRMDRLADGSHVLIDYKTGTVSPRNWEGARPEDPQLPLYAANSAEDISGVVFAKLKTGAMRFMGYSRDKGALPKVIQYKGWEALLQGWNAEVHRLGTGFAAGEAAVDPKKHGVTCRYCSLQPLCRVHERFSALDLDADVARGDADADNENGEGGE
jgi:RecB family exonuclease